MCVLPSRKDLSFVTALYLIIALFDKAFSFPSASEIIHVIYLKLVSAAGYGMITTVFVCN